MDAATEAVGRPVIARLDFERAIAMRDLLETLGNADTETIARMASELQSLYARRARAMRHGDDVKARRTT